MITKQEQTTRTLTMGLLMLPFLLWSTSGLTQSREDTAAACNEAANLLNQDDVAGALEEARWCVEGLEQMKQQAALSVLPDSVGSFVGGDVQNQSALGMTMLERSYRSDEGSINVSLTTGAASGGLAALAQMGMSLGAGTGKKMRIQKRTVTDMSQPEGEAQFMLQLKSGGMMNISSSDVASERVVAFLKEFPIRELDEALEP